MHLIVILSLLEISIYHKQPSLGVRVLVRANFAVSPNTAPSKLAQHEPQATSTLCDCASSFLPIHSPPLHHIHPSFTQISTVALSSFFFFICAAPTTHFALCTIARHDISQLERRRFAQRLRLLSALGASLRIILPHLAIKIS